MRRASLLIVTALVEAGVGLLLLIRPAGPFEWLLGVGQPSPEALVLARVTGAALLAIGVACWLARNDERSAAQFGLLTGVLIYDGAAAAVLAWAALGPGLLGLALWPAVVLHAGLAVWSLLCLCARPAGRA